MKITRGLIVFLCSFAAFIALVFAQGSGSGAEVEKSKKPAGEIQDRNEDSEYLVMGYLQTRNRVITLSQGPGGTVYTIKDKSGKTLARNIDEKTLETHYPQLHRKIKDGLAGNDAGLRNTTPLIKLIR